MILELSHFKHCLRRLPTGVSDTVFSLQYSSLSCCFLFSSHIPEASLVAVSCSSSSCFVITFVDFSERTAQSLLHYHNICQTRALKGLWKSIIQQSSKTRENQHKVFFAYKSWYQQGKNVMKTE